MVSHRIQLTPADASYARLIEESRRSGVPPSEVLRRALDDRDGTRPSTDMLHALDASFGSWSTRGFDGASYVEELRGGLATRRGEAP